MGKKFRIVTDDYAGYEVQSWRWWFPFWVQCWDYGPINTWPSIHEAETFAREGGKRKTRRSIVKIINPLPTPGDG